MSTIGAIIGPLIAAVLLAAILLGFLFYVFSSVTQVVGNLILGIGAFIFRMPTEAKSQISPELGTFPSWPVSLNREQIGSLEGYRPSRPRLVRVPSAEIEPIVKERRSRWGTKIHVNDVAHLAETPFERIPSLDLLSSIETTLPTKSLDEVSPPPEVESVSFSVPKPSISLPRIPWVLGFMNGIVARKYEKEIAEVKEAQRDWDRARNTVELANQQIETERQLANKRYQDAVAERDAALADLRVKYGNWERERKQHCAYQAARIRAIRAQTDAEGYDGLKARIEFVLGNPLFPSFVPIEHEPTFDSDNETVICEHQFPDLRRCEFVKSVELKSGWKEKPANRTERAEAASKVYPILALRMAREIAEQDRDDIVSSIVLNGWAEFIDPATGQDRRAFVTSLIASKEELLSLNLALIDPVPALRALRGASTNDVGIVPITPQLRINRDDRRFVEAKNIIDGIERDENIAAMDWEDFEHLCRELFERVFAEDGSEVHVTQASRDQGVDAVIYDPDPIKGGKIVVQAKRYVNLVDVSAVRDLFGTVHNEGAMKGILVTTSNFGPEAYSFARGKPITLINGSELLGLLETHGYKFRIDIEEARRLRSE